MTAIDRAALIEAAFAGHQFDPEGRICSCGVLCGVVCDGKTFLEHVAETIMPVVVAAVLKPLRELHHTKAYTCTHLRTPGELGPCCRHEICDACNQMHPCPTVRMLDQIEADVKGDE